MIISHTHRYVFVHVHKTAGEAITAALLPYLTRSDELVTSGALLAVRQRLGLAPRLPARLTKHSTAAEAKAALPAEVWDGYFTFAMVRNPIDRALSLYNYLSGVLAERQRSLLRRVAYRTPLVSSRDPLRWPGAHAVLATASFSEFIRHPDALRAKAMQPQHASITGPDGEQLLDFVGRYETVQDDLASVFGRLQLPQPDLKPTNTSHRVLATRDLAADDIDYLADLYRRDFELFDYRMPSAS